MGLLKIEPAPMLLLGLHIVEIKENRSPVEVPPTPPGHTAGQSGQRAGSTAPKANLNFEYHSRQRSERDFLGYPPAVPVQDLLPKSAWSSARMTCSRTAFDCTPIISTLMMIVCTRRIHLWLLSQQRRCDGQASQRFAHVLNATEAIFFSIFQKSSLRPN
jgi:hypothetical protein